VDIGCHPHHVNDAVFSGEDVLFVVAAAHIRHHGNLQGGLIFPHNGADILLIAEFPFAKFVGVEQLLGGLVAKFHIVHPCFDVCFIQIPGKFIRKGKIIDKPPVPERAVHNLDVGAVVH